MDMMFQSLFYWILFLRLSLAASNTFFLVVSILVLLDFVLKAHFEERRPHMKRRFNPCFIGFCS